MSADFPDVLPGHWYTAEGAVMARDYAGKTREQIAGGQHSDMEVANDIFLIHRNSPALIAVQTVAKERIRWLSVQLAITTMEKAELLAASKDLLKYAEHMMAAYEGEHTSRATVAELEAHGEVHEEIIEARAAITKAEGR